MPRSDWSALTWRLEARDGGDGGGARHLVETRGLLQTVLGLYAFKMLLGKIQNCGSLQHKLLVKLFLDVPPVS